MNPLQNILDYINAENLWESELMYNRKSIIKSAGKIDQNIYYIKEGSVRIYILDKEEEHTIRFGYQDNIIAALDSFITGKPSALIIETLRASTVKVMKKSALMQLFNDNHDLLESWRNLMDQLIVQQMERELDLLTSSPVQRYERVLQRSPQLFQQIPNKYIADYLRTTPETLSRIKKS